MWCPFFNHFGSNSPPLAAIKFACPHNHNMVVVKIMSNLQQHDVVSPPVTWFGSKSQLVKKLWFNSDW